MPFTGDPVNLHGEEGQGGRRMKPDVRPCHRSGTIPAKHLATFAELTFVAGVEGAWPGSSAMLQLETFPHKSGRHIHPFPQEGL
jgi:hypothetical protein